MTDLETFLTTGVLAFMLGFVRIGTAVMIMPGVGNTFVPIQVRLLFSLGFAFVLFPLIQAKIPKTLPGSDLLTLLILTEFVIGLFIGTVSRILMAALDVAGMIISMQSSLASAQLFNPAFAAQGSIVGTFLTLAGMVLLFSTDLHHLMILGIVQSYDVFPLGSVPDTESMAKVVVDHVGGAFAVGIQITAPFLLLVLLLYVGMGVMSKLMPQVQVFMLAIPVQILLALFTLVMVISAMMLVWLGYYQQGMSAFLAPTSGSGG